MAHGLIVALIIALGLETFAVAFVIDDRLMAWFLRRGRYQPWPVARWVLVAHCAWLVAWLVVAVTGNLVYRSTGSHAAVGWLVVPMIAIYGPFLIPFLPSKFGGYSFSRRDLRRKLGASNAVSRAVYWTGAPFALIGMMICFAAFAICFDP
jgi:hypothetical protein